MDDVPARVERFPNEEDYEVDEVIYPTSVRYTLQVFERRARRMHARLGFRNNTDAAFHLNTRDHKPSCLLLTYVYGVAAVKNWGQNWEDVLSKDNRPNLQRPAEIPSRTAIKKRNALNNANLGGMDGGEGESTEREREYGPEEVIAFLWANTSAARQRRRDEKDQASQKILDWQAHVET